MDGVARHILDLSAGLDARGWKVTIATRAPEWFKDRVASPSIGVVGIPMVRRISPLADLRSFVRLARLSRKLRPDVFHLHSSKAGFLGRVARPIARARVLVYTPHCWSFQPVQGRTRRFYATLERIASRFCDMTIAVSQQEIDEAAQLRVLSRDKITLIRNAVPPSPGEGRLPTEVANLIAPADRLVVSAGRLGEPKGYPYLIDAMGTVLASEPDARCIVAGDGPLADQLRARAESRGVAERVHFVGELDGIAELLDRAQLFVMSSLWEGLPYVILEAMAAGLPVVATNVGGCPELVEDGTTGLIVAPGQAELLAKAILALLGDPEKSARMGAAGRARATNEFSFDRWLNATELVYLGLLDRDGGNEESPAATATQSQHD